jgi:PilZ domain-containing protein
MNSGHLIPRMTLKKKPAPRDRRGGAERAPMYGHATYTYKAGLFIFTIDGRVRDLSETGCSIRGTMPQVVGRQIRLMLSLHDEQEPLYVKGAIVSWVATDCFGVKFPKLKPNEYNRLRQHIRKMASVRVPVSSQSTVVSPAMDK